MSEKPPTSSRPSVRTVARLAGVSAMTVSRVLRNHPRVTAKTRAIVLKAARKVGYQPDPQVAKLMYHLRVRRTPSFQSAICALTSLPSDAPRPNYTEGILRGASRQAEARGYGFTLLHIGGGNDSPRVLQRILRSRGVEGVILLPMAVPAALPDLLDWREFSVIATTSSVLAPEVHSVIPHHFKNTQMLCRELTARGYQRIGLVLTEEHVERVYHAHNAAIAWHGIFGRDAFVPPLVYRGSTPAMLPEWFEREQPDVIVTNAEALARNFAQILRCKIPGPVGFATTNLIEGSVMSGIDERPRQIGAAAVDLLTGMIQRGEKGVPAVPSSLLLQGRWVEGRTCPVRKATPVAKLPRYGRLLYRE